MCMCACMCVCACACACTYITADFKTQYGTLQ